MSMKLTIFALVSLAMKFRKHDEQKASSVWEKNLLKYSSQIYLDANVADEFKRGLELGFQPGLATELSFNSHHMVSFLFGTLDMKHFGAVV